MKKKAALIFVICCIPRAVYLLFNLNAGLSNNSYWAFSDSLLQSRELYIGIHKTTFMEPLVPFFLACLRWITGDNHFLVRVLQIMIGAVGCLYLYKLSFLLSAHRGVALFSSMIYSFYPYLIRQSVAINEVALYTTLLIMSSYYYSAAQDIRTSLLCGFVFGLTVLARVTILPAWVLAVSSLIFRRHFVRALTIGVTTVVLVTPLFVRNYLVNGSFFPTRSGFNLLKGNCEYSDKVIPQYNVDVMDPFIGEILLRERPELIDGSEKEIDQFFTQKALEFIKENPLRTLKLKFLNVLYFFHPRIVPFYPLGQNTRLLTKENGEFTVENVSTRGGLAEWAHSIIYSFVFITALAGMYLRKKEWEKDQILYWIILSFTFTYSLYLPATRYRVPMDFVFMFYSAYALTRFISTHRVFAWIKVQRLA